MRSLPSSPADELVEEIADLIFPGADDYARQLEAVGRFESIRLRILQMIRDVRDEQARGHSVTADAIAAAFSVMTAQAEKDLSEYAAEESDCPTCGGSGGHDEWMCKACAGSGKRR